MFWNCACLISDAGGTEDEENETNEEEIEEQIESYYNEMEEFTEDDESEVEDSYDEDEDCDGYPVEVKVLKTGKKKKKAKAVNYGKIASAIGKIKSSGIEISSPDINNSTYTFSPDIVHNTIRYGLSGITRIGEDLIQQIIAGRPYSGWQDFITRIKINKPQMINLIKAGTFDCFGNRIDILHEYVDYISDTKKKITLQNMKMLIEFGLLPDEYDFHCRVYNFNKYIKKLKLDSNYYSLDNVAFAFIERNNWLDMLQTSNETESNFKMSIDKWDKIYKHYMSEIKSYIQANHDQLLQAINFKLTNDVWNKYCIGTVSKWEMDSISCYIHTHELENVNKTLYEITDFNTLSTSPDIDRYIPIKGQSIPLFTLHRIMGTVLDRDKNRQTVTILTPTGIVLVKVHGVFAEYDKQISVKGADGKKHIIEKSMFTRGNKIIVTGIRREDNFIAKTYRSTPYHKIEQILEVYEDGTLNIKKERAEVA